MDTTQPKKKRGRPVTGQALTAAQRQKASRAERKLQRFESFPPQYFSGLLSGEATQSLRMLSINRDTSQKEVIEGLLIEAYAKMKS